MGCEPFQLRTLLEILIKNIADNHNLESRSAESGNINIAGYGANMACLVDCQIFMPFVLLAAYLMGLVKSFREMGQIWMKY